MSEPMDLEIVSPSVIGKLTREQVVNYIDQRIEELVAMIRCEPPPPTDEVTARLHVRWRHRMLIFYGQCVGTIRALQAVGVISIEQFNVSKAKLLATMTHKMTNVVMKP